jgi:hypothetical protein
MRMIVIMVVTVIMLVLGVIVSVLIAMQMVVLVLVVQDRIGGGHRELIRGKYVMWGLHVKLLSVIGTVPDRELLSGQNVDRLFFGFVHGFHRARSWQTRRLDATQI